MGILCALSRSSTALSCARCGSREPMMIEWPAMAQRVARPAPSLPVPPRIAMFMGEGPSSEKIAVGIAEQRLAAAAVVRGHGQPADDGGRNAVELAHHGL